MLATCFFAVVAAPASVLPAPKSDFFLNVSYFNAATLGPCSRDTVRRMADDMALMESNPADHYFGKLDPIEYSGPTFLQRNEQVRSAVATFIGAESVAEVALMPSTTVSLNTVADGLISSGFLSPGDHVLTTDQEHAGGYVNWVHYANCTHTLRAAGWCSSTGAPSRANATKNMLIVDILEIPVTPAAAAPKTVADIVARFELALTREPRTRVVAVSHVTTTHGLVLPIKELAQLAHSRGAILVVDGAQALGMPVNVTAMGADIYATSAHKWLLAPKGSGVLYVSKHLQHAVTATVLDGGMATYTAQTGTRPAHTINGLGYAVDYFARFGGPSAIGAYNLELRAKAYDLLLPHLLAANGSMIGAPGRSGPLVSPILTFALPQPGWTAAAFAAQLAEQGMIVKMGGRGAFANEGGPTMPMHAIRLSFHLYNTEADVRQLISAIGTLLRNTPEPLESR